MDDSFLGTGWSFPPTFRDQGRSLTMVSAEEDIRQSLMILLGTHVGERVMRPTFGWRRDTLIFEPMSAGFATFLRQEIEKAVLFHEPRVIVDRVTFEALSDLDGRITLALDYTVRATNTRNNLVFPFYLAEATNA